LIFLFIGIVLAGWALDWKARIETLDRSKEAEVSLKREFSEKKARSINLDLYAQQLTEIDRAFGVLLRQLPSRSEVESLLIEINQSGMGRGLQFELFKPNPEIIRDFYAELPISIRLTGSYHDFGAFAADISKLSRIVTLANISITAPPQARDGILVMNATTRTFRYLDEEELAAQRRAQTDQRGRR
jgi:type IV pilus assembly protein PilO